MKQKMMAGYTTTVYSPPKEGLPYLAVIIDPSGKVTVFPHSSLKDAEVSINNFIRGYNSEEPFDTV